MVSFRDLVGRGGAVPVNKRVLGAVGSAASEAAARRLPQITNPLLVGAVTVGAVGVGAALTAVRPHGRDRRQVRIAQWVAEACGASAGSASEGRGGVTRRRSSSPHASTGGVDSGGARGLLAGVPEVEVHEGFGKPGLVVVTARVRTGLGDGAPAEAGAEPESGTGVGAEGVSDSRGASPGAVDAAPAVVDALVDLLARAAWDNPVMAPVAVRVCLAPSPGGDVMAEGGAGGPGSVGDSRGAGAGPVYGHGYGEAEPVTVDLCPSELFARFGAPASDPHWRP